MPDRRKPTAQPSAVSHTSVGDVVVSVVNDGVFQLSFDDVVGAPRAAVEAAHGSQFRAVPPWLTVNTFLVRTPGRLVLVDTGFIGRTPLVGNLVPNLASVGVLPADIDAILMTHMHPDHEAGLTDAGGRAVFPRAELVVNEDELAFWQDDGALARAGEADKRHFGLARTALAAYQGRITAVADGVEPVSGIRLFATPGHTPGHSAWHIHSAGESMLIWGDVVHFPGVQLPIPDAGVVFDIDRAAAAATRKRVLDQVASDRIRVAGIHLDWPAFGRIVRRGEGYDFLPEVWQPAV
jgi:glyoxylase-like metal-dependent hydrolase (beta-lactamase superfamily II)